MTGQPPLRALTLRPPWPHFIFADDLPHHIGPKDIENRPRRPGQLVGQRIAIHVGLAYSFTGAHWLLDLLGGSWPVPRPGDCNEGYIVGVARVVGSVHKDALCISDTHRRAQHSRWFMGGDQHGWILVDRIRLPVPVPCSGNQIYGWVVPPEPARRVLDQLAFT